MRLTLLAAIAALMSGAVGSHQPASNATSTRSGVVQEHGRLRVRSGRVVDALGQPLTLRGMSLYWSQWKPAFYNPGAVQWLATDWQATAVRAAIAADRGGYLTNPGAELKRAQMVIDGAIKAGVYVVVDWHAHDPLPDEASAFFSVIARRYRGVPNLIYETWNEPLPKYGWSEVIKPYHERVIAAIRREDPGAFVVAGTRSWDQDVHEASADPLDLPNVAYALHFYAATHKGELRAKADRALKDGVALFVTEYGLTAANGDAPLDIEEARRWWAWCDRHGISYLNWSLSDQREASAALRPGASPRGGWSQTMLTTSGTLVRNHLRASRTAVQYERESGPGSPPL